MLILHCLANCFDINKNYRYFIIDNILSINGIATVAFIFVSFYSSEIAISF